MHYGVIWSSIFDGTLRECWEALVTFEQIRILADQDHVLDMTREAIHHRTGIPIEIIRKGIAWLEQPHPSSRSQEADGRVIIRIDPNRDWGWVIVNGRKYREMLDKEFRRAQAKERMAEVRARMRTDENTREHPRTDANGGEQSEHVQICSPLEVDVALKADTDTDVPSVSSEPQPTYEASEAILALGAPAQPSQAPDRVLTRLPLRDRTDYELTDTLADEYQPLFPLIDVREEFMRMRAWALGEGSSSLPTRRGVRRFIRNWLDGETRRVQAGKRPRARARAPDRPTPAVVEAGRDAVSEHLAQKGDG